MNSIQYKFDPMHTSVMWCCSHFGFSSPKGQFTMINGELSFNEASPELSKFNVVIDINTLSTGIEKFNEHLKSKDFFNYAEFPEAVFKSSKITMIDRQNMEATGDFTLLGVTKSVILKVAINLSGIKCQLRAKK